MGKIGLVLSGGGAKGAYEVGVIHCLSDMGIAIDAISAASIGSLNGAIVASSPDLASATSTLERVWMEAVDRPPVGINNFNLISAISHLNPSGSDKDSVFDNSIERAYISDYVNFERLRTGIPLFISVYETESRFVDILKYFFRITHDSTTIKIQDMKSTEDMINLLLASSALPFIFRPVAVAGKSYRDGGLGAKEKGWGNTPIKPLLDCSIVIVVHLEDGALWSRHDFDGPAIVEIRPLAKPLKRGMLDVIGFDRTRVSSWMDQGYSDARAILGRVVGQFGKLELIHSNSMKLISELARLENDGFHIDD